jgi:hypothetical protein
MQLERKRMSFFLLHRGVSHRTKACTWLFNMSWRPLNFWVVVSLSLVLSLVLIWPQTIVATMLGLFQYLRTK